MSEVRVADQIASTLSLRPEQVAAAVTLFEEGCTVPFIARYRKERTGALDEVQLRNVQAELERVQKLEARRETVLNTLRERGVTNARLLRDVRAAATMTQLDDLYAPYRPKRQTRAQKAIEAGLEPLADAICDDARDATRLASRHTSDAFSTAADALRGAQDIIAERIADDARVRAFLREKAQRFGRLQSDKKRGAEPDPRYELYLGFDSSVTRLRPHQLLAMRRGEKEGVLRVKCAGEDDRWGAWVRDRWARARDARNQEVLEAACADSYKRLLWPNVERELRAALETDADAHAIDVFARNLKNLLLQPPLPNQRVLGVDPGLRTGCKLAVVDETGDLLATTTCYTHDRRKEQAPAQLRQLIERHGVTLIAIGNGTGTNEAQEAVVAALQGARQAARYAVVDEAGASVYSASELAREEFPDLDVSLRGAVSIARRLQDPLAELVKIDPRSIGVGMYQHDVNQRALERALDAVVEDVVNAVGVDLNTASAALLTRISGLSARQAQHIVDWRAEHGAFTSRDQLREVRGIGPRTFEQCAGFLRIRDGRDPLDNTGVHPERYALARVMLRSVGATQPDPELERALLGKLTSRTFDALAAEHEVGRPTLLDLIDDLTSPGRDPRARLDAPQLRDQLLTMDDLEPGMVRSGTVRNVVDFGAFIDIGVKQDGLVHISEMSEQHVRDPHTVVSVGQRVTVTILSIDRRRGRISLSMKRR